MNQQLRMGLYAIAALTCASSVMFFLVPYLNTTTEDVFIDSLSYVLWYLFVASIGISIFHQLTKSLAIKTILLLVIYFNIGICIGHVFEKLDYKNALNHQKIEILTQSKNLRSNLESAIWSDINIANTMAQLVQEQEQFTDDDFDKMSSMILKNSKHLRHLALAKDLVVSNVYPLEGNSKAIGLDYRTNKQQWPLIKKSIDMNRIILAGPVNLVQGGTALIGRVPIQTKGIKGDDEVLWGILSIIIDMDALFLFSGFSELDSLNIAVRGKDSMGAQGGTIYGDAKLFDDSPLIDDIRLPYGSWQLAIAPMDGWVQHSPSRMTIWLSIFIMCLFVLIFTLTRAFTHRSKERSINKLKVKLNTESKLSQDLNEQTKNLQQTQKLEAIGQLTGGIAHDFNNILAAITGYAQLSQMILENDQNKEKLPNHINEIIRAGERAKTLVKQMLTFSSGRDVQAKVIEPMSVLQETLQMLHSILPASIRLETDYQDFDSRIKIDPVQLQQLLVNLVVNARDAIPHNKGSITIATSYHVGNKEYCTSCKETISGNYLSLSITDDGTGIEQNIIDKIFDPFFTTKEVGEGTGMGLSVVHGIIHGAGGHIILNSKMNEGTSINLLLPVTNDPVTDQPADFKLPEVGPARNMSTSKVLVVDDEVSITKLYDDAFEARNIDSVIFTEPELALDYYQQNREQIAVIISDYTMPHMSGTEFIQAIRRKDKNIPIILCSGNAEVVDQSVFNKLNVTHFITKPMDLIQLSLLVSNYLK